MESRIQQSKDFTAAVAAIRQYWGSDHEYSDAELFALARRRWEDAKGDDSAARGFMLQVVACRLEEQLLMWLMQFLASDAATVMQMLVQTCTDQYFTADGLEPLSPLLDTLLMAAVLRAAACDRSAENRKRRIAEMVERLDATGFVKGNAWGAIQALDMMKEDGGTWEHFLDLPSELEARLFNSRSGRAFLDEAQQVVALQQSELGEVFWASECYENGEKSPTADTLWTLAEKLVELVSAHPKAREDAQDDNGVRFNVSGTARVVVESVVDLEEHLKAKEAISSSSSITEPLAQDVLVNGSDANLSAIEQLSQVCSSSDEGCVASSGLLQKVFEELSAVTSLDVLSIHASFVLSLQMRAKHCFVDRNESTKAEFERRVRGVFNRLTGKKRDLEHAASLIALAAFCPGQVIRQFVRGARTDVLHHKLYLKVLDKSPLLLDWTETPEGIASVLECQLQQCLAELSSEQSCFDRESQNVISFLLALVGVSKGVLSKQEKPVMTISKLFDRVLNPLFSIVSSGERTTNSMEMQLNLYALALQLLQVFVMADVGTRIQPGVLESSFGLVFRALQSTESSNPRLDVSIRESLHLILKRVMELMVEPATMTIPEKFETPLNSSLWTLLSLFNIDLGSDEMCKGLEDVTASEAYLQASPDEESAAYVPLPNVISAVQVLLWGLLWDSMLSANASVESTKSETWSLLDRIAGHEFPHTGSTSQTVEGRLLIQSALAELMLECGTALFHTLYENIIPYLLQYESIEASTLPEETIAIPEWAADKVPSQPEFDLQISCWLQSTQAAMRYVAKCWGLSCAASTHLGTASSILLVESLSHVLSALDQAATSSAKSLSRTLFCIQWLCSLVSTAYKMRLDALPTWPTVRTQSELSLLRLLHQLDQLKGTETTDAHFSQYFLAAWLAYLPGGQFDQVFNFLASRTNT